MKENTEELILELARRFENDNPIRISPGEDFIPHAAKILDRFEIINGIQSIMEGWLTSGKRSEEFEKGLSDFVGTRSATLVNSGSSANLVALSSLTSKTLGERRINPGDEVITVAAGFPTTINPIIQVGAIPVFVDVDLPSYNINIEAMKLALSKKTKAVMIAHTLGNPFNLKEVLAFCKENQLWLVEDNCDALGSTYEGKKTGSFGDFATLSFYPAHHITTGEGGAVLTSRPRLRVLAESFRDWGRDCYCLPGKDDTCQKRFSQQHGELPFGYDHKFVYGHIGYNLKMTDLQAAIGEAQLNKLEKFVEARKTNWRKLRKSFSNLEEAFILPESEIYSEPSWFGFALTIREESKISREELLKYLGNKKIGTRLLFSGDIRKQPAYLSQQFREVGKFENTDKILKSTFWIGCWPGLEDDHLNYMYDSIRNFVNK